MKCKKFTQRALLLALMCSSVGLMQAKDVYLSNGGDDANDGSTPELAVATLSRAYTLIDGTENTIYVSGEVESNTTVNGLVINTGSLTVEGIEGEDAKITGDSIRLFYVNGNAVLTLKNLHLAGNPAKSLVGQGGCISIVNGGGLFADNVIFEDFSTAIDPAKVGNPNSDTGAAGVIYLQTFNAGSSNPVISFTNCQFKNNFTTGTWGGGVMRVQDFGNAPNPRVYFENCGFYGNYTERGNPGGSVLVVRPGTAATSEVSFVNSTITACGVGGSGAIAFSGAGMTLNLINSTIKDNPVSGIICWEIANSTMNIYNSVIENNAGANMNDIRFSENLTTPCIFDIKNSLIGNPLWRNVEAYGNIIPYTKPAEYTVGTLFEALDETTISFKPAEESLAINYGDAQYLSGLGADGTVDIDYDQLNGDRLFLEDKCDAGAVETEKTPTGLQAAATSNNNVAYAGAAGQIIVKSDARAASVYSITGQKLAEQTLSNGENTIDRTFDAGIYLVKTGGITTKVVVK